MRQPQKQRRRQSERDIDRPRQRQRQRCIETETDTEINIDIDIDTDRSIGVDVPTHGLPWCRMIRDWVKRFHATERAGGPGCVLFWPTRSRWASTSTSLSASTMEPPMAPVFLFAGPSTGSSCGRTRCATRRWRPLGRPVPERVGRVFLFDMCETQSSNVFRVCMADSMTFQLCRDRWCSRSFTVCADSSQRSAGSPCRLRRAYILPKRLKVLKTTACSGLSRHMATVLGESLAKASPVLCGCPAPPWVPGAVSHRSGRRSPRQGWQVECMRRKGLTAPGSMTGRTWPGRGVGIDDRKV